MKSLLRILGYGIQGFRRNIWLSVIAIITMTLTITTMTVFFLGNVVANKKYQEYNSRIDYFIFLNDEASDADVAQFRQQIAARPEVSRVVNLSKDDVLKNFEQGVGKEEGLQGVITSDSNPLARESDVTFKDTNQIATFDGFVHQDRFKQIVQRTSYDENKTIINNYVRFTNFFRIFAISFTSFFVLIAIIVVFNTLRLAIYSRREEIEVMRLVGATGGYIRGPFLVEGVFFGILGALFASLIAWAFLSQLQQLLANSQATQSTNSLTDLFGSSFQGLTTAGGFNNLFTQLVLLQLGVGLLLGIICSFLAVRRYLKEQ